MPLDNPVEQYVLHPDLIQASQAGADGGQPDEQRKLAGKYQSVEELERGYWNQAQETQRILEENQALRARMTNLDDGFQTRESPRERAANRQYVDTLANAGVPVDALTQMIQEQVAGVVRPMVAGAAARDRMVHEYPEFAQHEPEVAQFLEAHPDMRSRFQAQYPGDPEMAMEWAYTQFRKHARPASASGRDNNAARLDAALPARNVDRAASVGTDNAVIDSQQYADAMKRAGETGDWTRVIMMQANLGSLKTG